METTKRKPGRALLAVVALFAVLTILTLAGFLYGWRPALASEEGAGIDQTITYLLVVTGFILLLGHGVLCVFLWKSAAWEGTPYQRPSKRSEWIWGLVPVFFMLVISEAGVLVVSGPVWDSLYAEQPANPLVAEVVGKQFEWLMRYPGEDGTFGRDEPRFVDGVDNPIDDIVKRNQLYLPVGREIVLRLRTQDVIHSFFSPHFRVKQDIIPGFTTRLKFTPTRTGVYELVCAELCGLGHYTMRGEIHVVSPEEFAAWLAKQTRFGG